MYLEKHLKMPATSWNISETAWVLHAIQILHKISWGFFVCVCVFVCVCLCVCACVFAWGYVKHTFLHSILMAKYTQQNWVRGLHMRSFPHYMYCIPFIQAAAFLFDGMCSIQVKEDINVSPHGFYYATGRNQPTSCHVPFWPQISNCQWWLQKTNLHFTS